MGKICILSNICYLKIYQKNKRKLINLEFMFMQFISAYFLDLTQKNLHKIEEIGLMIVMRENMVV
jgi:hypothetical protein